MSIRDNSWRRPSRVVVCGVLAVLIGPARAAVPSPIKLSGAIEGMVCNTMGIPQMGATVLLYNRQERPYGKLLTDERGEFRFAGLLPDIYSIRVTLAAFMPALRNNILVQPGMKSVLNVNLSTLFSTIQLAYPSVENGSLMTDDFKWVLRSASATRPVLRFLETDAGRTVKSEHTAVFSDTRGILRLSAGEGPLASGTGSEADLGTAFALATSLYGNNMLQVAGNLGYGSQTGVPVAAFRTSYSRDLAGGSPEVSVTMRQLFLPGRFGAALAGADGSLPMLRSLSTGFEDRMQLAECLALRYGFTMDSVSFLDHLNYFSPYARLSYALGAADELDVAFTSGNARPELGGAAAEDLQRDLNSLALFPLVSLRAARPKIQRGEEYEIAYSHKMGSRTYSVSAYRESVSNAALTIAAPAGLYAGGDILPDLFSGISIFNAGNYQSTGYTAGVTQSVGDRITASLMYGSTGGLTADSRELVSTSPDELRSMIRAGRRHAATARITATSPWTGTHFIASYQWTNDHRFVSAGNIYSTLLGPMPGLNLYFRQPIPRLSKRVEATADLRNMLAQGYLPLSIAGGQRVLLMQTPRSVRGGLSFIF